MVPRLLSTPSKAFSFFMELTRSTVHATVILRPKGQAACMLKEERGMSREKRLLLFTFLIKNR